MISIKFKNFLFLISLIVIFTTQFGYYKFNTSVSYIILLFWIIYSFFEFVFHRKKVDNISKTFLFYNFGIKVIIYLYTIILIVLGLTEKRFFSSNLQTFINGLSAILLFSCFGKKTLRLSLDAIYISWFIMAFSQLLVGRIYFEFHDIAFALGFVFIVMFSNKYNNFRWYDYLMVIIIEILAYKRIGLGALLIVFFINLILKLLKPKTQNMLLNIISLLYIVASFSFIFLVTSGKLWDIFDKFGIETSGRFYYYQIFIEKAKMSPSFLGLGRNSFAVLCTTDFSYMRVGNIHSDILRMYGECGFILFIIWLLTYFIFIPFRLNRVVSFDAKRIFILCTFYLFIVYFTDNTELYLITQYFYILVCLNCVKIKSKSKKITFQYKNTPILKKRG